MLSVDFILQYEQRGKAATKSLQHRGHREKAHRDHGERERDRFFFSVRSVSYSLCPLCSAFLGHREWNSD